MILAIAATTMVASGVQSIAGMGFGLVAMPLFVGVFGPAEGVLWGNIIGTVTSATLFVEKRRDVNWKIALRFIVAATPIIFLTVYATRGLNQSMMNIVVGVVMLALVTFAVFAKRLPDLRGVLPMYATGAIGGFLSAAVGQAGPVLTAYARAARWPQRSFAATLQVYFLGMNALNIPLKLSVGYGPTDATVGWLTFGAGFFGIMIGSYIARRISSKITSRQASSFAMIVATVGATLVLTRGLIGIFG